MFSGLQGPHEKKKKLYSVSESHTRGIECAGNRLVRTRVLYYTYYTQAAQLRSLKEGSGQTQHAGLFKWVQEFLRHMIACKLSMNSI